MKEDIIKIRQCRCDDFYTILKLLQQLWPDKTLDKNSLRLVYNHALVSESQIYVCAEEKTKVIGIGSLTIKNNQWQEGFLGHIDELVVDKENRGKGVGTKLLHHLNNIAQEKGCKRVELDSAFFRKSAHKFYKKLGFENRAYLFSKVLE